MLHALYGGVVPELASREHLRNIVPVVRGRCEGRGPGLTARVARCDCGDGGPGLAGALLVGITYAKALAFGLGKPLIAVNHLEGHIYAVLMERGAGAAGGGGAPVRGTGGFWRAHAPVPGVATEWAGDVAVPRRWGGRWMMRRARPIDKVAKLLGLGYPGGPWIDALATAWGPEGGAVSVCGDQASRGVEPDEPRFDFSFQRDQDGGAAVSGDARDAGGSERRGGRGVDDARSAETIAGCWWGGSLPRADAGPGGELSGSGGGRPAAADVCGRRGRLGPRRVLVTGGVAANAELRRRFHGGGGAARAAGCVSDDGAIDGQRGDDCGGGVAEAAGG